MVLKASKSVLGEPCGEACSKPRGHDGFHERLCWICRKPVPVGGPFTNRCADFENCDERRKAKGYE